MLYFFILAGLTNLLQTSHHSYHPPNGLPPHPPSPWLWATLELSENTSRKSISFCTSVWGSPHQWHQIYPAATNTWQVTAFYLWLPPSFPSFLLLYATSIFYTFLSVLEYCLSQQFLTTETSNFFKVSVTIIIISKTLVKISIPQIPSLVMGIIMMNGWMLAFLLIVVNKVTEA